MSVSSRSESGARSGGSSAAADPSRFRRALSLRHPSTRRREATVRSHARGWSGTPSSDHWSAAASKRLLDRVLAGIEPPVTSHEGAEDLRRELAQQVLERGVRPSPQRNSSGGPSITWRTSMGPSVKATTCFANPIARASSSTSMIQ